MFILQVTIRGPSYLIYISVFNVLFSFLVITYKYIETEECYNGIHLPQEPLHT